MVEIERKFLVGNLDAALAGSVGRSEMVQGYFDSGVVTLRVRIADDRGFLTIKGATENLSRSEYEYVIPLADATAMLAEFCGTRRVEKVRYFVPERMGRRWEIDIYGGANSGLATAELELESETASFDRPAWLGPEISADRRYSNRALALVPYSKWRS